MWLQLAAEDGKLRAEGLGSDLLHMKTHNYLLIVRIDSIVKTSSLA
jgi:hypothetical protein